MKKKKEYWESDYEQCDKEQAEIIENNPDLLLQYLLDEERMNIEKKT